MDKTQRMGVGGVEAEKRIILPCVLGMICNGLQGTASAVCKVVS